MGRTARIWCAAASLLAGLVPLGATHAQSYQSSVGPDEIYLGFFGQAVALSSDTLAVGSPGANEGGNDAGEVRVFTLQSGNWVSQADLHALDAATNFEFGAALSLDGDALLIGSWGRSDGSWVQPGYHRGAAYVFRRTGTNWAQEVFLQPAAVEASDHFGRAVALDGDVAVVGAPYADPLGQRSGRVWIFRRIAGIWSQEAVLTAPDGGAEQRFGAAVAVAGNTLVVGAPIATGAVPRSGATYVFTFDGSAWTLQQKLGATGGAREDRFGQALALDGERLAVGAPQRDATGAPDAGAVVLFTRTAGTWTQEAQLAAPAPRPLGGLGTSLALQGDALVTGVLEDDEAAPKAGAAFVFRRTAGSWGFHAKLTSPLAKLGDALGGAVALDGDRAALGTVWRDNTPLGHGAVDLFSGITGGGP